LFTSVKHIVTIAGQLDQTRIPPTDVRHEDTRPQKQLRSITFPSIR